MSVILYYRSLFDMKSWPKWAVSKSVRLKVRGQLK